MHFYFLSIPNVSDLGILKICSSFKMLEILEIMGLLKVVLWLFLMVPPCGQLCLGETEHLPSHQLSEMRLIFYEKCTAAE